MLPDLMPGQLLARGVCRHLLDHGFVTVEELVPCAGLRVDVMALGPKGEIWIVECKSSRTDYVSDRKWQGYLEWADRFFWAVDTEFPVDLLPPETGLIMADGYGAAFRGFPVAACRRHAALRLQGLRDPGVTSGL